MMMPPRPANTVFGIRANGKTMSPGLPSVDQAEAVARGLFAHGYRVIEVIDRVTRQTVKRVTLSKG